MPGRLAVLVVVSVLAGLLWAAPARALPQEVDRLAGGNRYATAAAVSQASFPAGADTVFIATGEDYPDALAGAPSVARGGSGPILLTGRDGLPPETAAEIARLRPLGVVVLGGPDAVPDAVVRELQEFGAVDRIAGANRFATAALLSARGFPSGAPTVYVASGSDFPDALAAGAPAIAEGGPVLLTADDSLPSETGAELERLAPSRVVVLGSAAVVSDGVLVAVEDATGAAVERAAGPTRYDTAVAASRSAFGQAERVFVATGGGFADALGGSLGAGLAGGPLLFVPRDCIPGAVVGELDRLGALRMTILGGPDAVGPAVADLAVCGAGEPAPPEESPLPPPPGLTPDSRVSTAAFGPIRFGMTPQEATAAAGLPIRTEDPVETAPSCYYGSIADPAYENVFFLLGEGTIGSVQVYGDFLTDTGLGVDSPQADVFATYGDRVIVEDHVYVPGGLYLIVESPDGGGALIFETDGSPAQVVTAYRAGRFPEVAYIEGCL